MTYEISLSGVSFFGVCVIEQMQKITLDYTGHDKITDITDWWLLIL